MIEGPMKMGEGGLGLRKWHIIFIFALIWDKQRDKNDLFLRFYLRTLEIILLTKNYFTESCCSLKRNVEKGTKD